MFLTLLILLTVIFFLWFILYIACTLSSPPLESLYFVALLVAATTSFTFRDSTASLSEDISEDPPILLNFVFILLSLFLALLLKIIKISLGYSCHTNFFISLLFNPSLRLPDMHSYSL